MAIKKTKKMGEDFPTIFHPKFFKYHQFLVSRNDWDIWKALNVIFKVFSSKNYFIKHHIKCLVFPKKGTPRAFLDFYEVLFWNWTTRDVRPSCIRVCISTKTGVYTSNLIKIPHMGVIWGPQTPLVRWKCPISYKKYLFINSKPLVLWSYNWIN